MRVEVDLPLECTVLDGAGLATRTTPAIVRDLSAGGMRLTVPEPLWLGCHVRARLVVIHPPLAVGVVGRVVTIDRQSSGERQVGVEFQGIGRHERAALTRFVLVSARLRGDGARRVMAPDDRLRSATGADG